MNVPSPGMVPEGPAGFAVMVVVSVTFGTGAALSMVVSVTEVVAPAATGEVSVL